jgi:hypothetical protein
MRPTARMHHSGLAHSGIGAVAVALEDPFKISKEPFGSLPFTPQPEIEHDWPVWPTVLPEVRLPVPSFTNSRQDDISLDEIERIAI